jgi:DNA processing protein
LDDMVRCQEAIEITLVPGIGSLAQARLWQKCPQLSDVFQLDEGILLSLGLNSDSIHCLRGRVYHEMAREIADWSAREGCRILVRGDESYPRMLAEIYDPPLVLYSRGRLETMAAPCLAIVGTRRPTYYGLQIAEGLAADLGARGITIVSGLARGIDGAAHRGCMDGGGPTVAVLGCGIDVIYPKEHRQLTRRLLENGLLLSEFVPGTSPAPQNFPVRNRIISGLCLGTVIVEASEYSGSLITARLAMEQNREVFAVPGNLSSPQSFGPNFLIKQGAKLVQGWRDVVEEFPPEPRHHIFAGEEIATEVQTRLQMLTPEEDKVLHLLESDQAVHFDRVLRGSGLEISRLSNILLKLEMDGRIRQVPGNLYVKIARPRPINC